MVCFVTEMGEENDVGAVAVAAAVVVGTKVNPPGLILVFLLMVAQAISRSRCNQCKVRARMDMKYKTKCVSKSLFVISNKYKHMREEKKQVHMELLINKSPND